MTAAQQLAKSVATPGSSQWRPRATSTGSYHFAAANADEPYRLYVPTNWDGKTSLPLAMFLHGSGADESTYVDQNNKQLLTLAQQHGYLLVAPLGDKGAYGNFLRLTSPFGKPDEAAKLMAQVTAADERTNELSEQDVINVLELVLAEYPIDRASMFLFGHSMGSGGTWYIGGKYASYWKGLAPMSGPFVQETGYPWDALRNTFIFVTEGTQAPSVDGSHVLRGLAEDERLQVGIRGGQRRPRRHGPPGATRRLQLLRPLTNQVSGPGRGGERGTARLRRPDATDAEVSGSVVTEVETETERSGLV